MSSGWMILFGIEAISLAALCIGIVLYRRIIADHRIFIDSLEHTEKQERKERMGFLAWYYILSTLVIMLVITMMMLFYGSPLS